jgi:hypothetical protein
MRNLIERARRKAVDLERLLDARMTALVRPSPRGLEPLEVRHALLDEIEGRLVPGPKGTLIFPFDEVRVELLGGTSDEIAALEATLESDGGLEEAAYARLIACGCRPPDFALTIQWLPAAPGQGADDKRYRVHFVRTAKDATSEMRALATSLVITIGSGPSAVSREITKGRLDIGRVADVRDREGRLVRQNGLVVPEAEDPHNTVSRRHAHILVATDADGGTEYRIYDDGSRYGTHIVRNGYTITVHAGSLGVALRDGDELHFGEASATVEIGSRGD